MGHQRIGVLIAASLLVVVVAGGCSSSSKSSSSSSSSPSSSSSSSSSSGLVASSSGGNTVDVTVNDTKGTDGSMTLQMTPTTTTHGDVTFTVKNTGTIDHEVVVLKTDTPFNQLPVGTSEPDKVDESTSVGETGDPALKPGESRSFTVSGLAAGNYVLVCNIAKHYGLGMRSAFKVS